MSDPRGTHRYGLWIDDKPYLVAVADDTGMLVYRSLVLDVTDDRYQRVLDYIIDHRLVPAENNVETPEYVSDAMCGQVEAKQFVPQPRRLN